MPTKRKRNNNNNNNNKISPNRSPRNVKKSNRESPNGSKIILVLCASHGSIQSEKWKKHIPQKWLATGTINPVFVAEDFLYIPHEEEFIFDITNPKRPANGMELLIRTKLKADYILSEFCPLGFDVTDVTIGSPLYYFGRILQKHLKVNGYFLFAPDKPAIKRIINIFNNNEPLNKGVINLHKYLNENYNKTIIGKYVTFHKLRLPKKLIEKDT